MAPITTPLHRLPGVYREILLLLPRLIAHRNFNRGCWSGSLSEEFCYSQYLVFCLYVVKRRNEEPTTLPVSMLRGQIGTHSNLCRNRSFAPVSNPRLLSTLKRTNRRIGWTRKFISVREHLLFMIQSYIFQIVIPFKKPTLVLSETLKTSLPLANVYHGMVVKFAIVQTNISNHMLRTAAIGDQRGIMKFEI
ncbi:hypothetical protein LXL04_015448 [Taraxacum kok-saghyz]